MKSFDELHRETTAVHLDFLLTDLRAAFTFLDVAEATQNSETRSRNVKNATVAHDAVLKFWPRVPMSVEQNAKVRERLDSLLVRIKSFAHPEQTAAEEAPYRR